MRSLHWQDGGAATYTAHPPREAQRTAMNEYIVVFPINNLLYLRDLGFSWNEGARHVLR